MGIARVRRHGRLVRAHFERYTSPDVVPGTVQAMGANAVMSGAGSDSRSMIESVQEAPLASDAHDVVASNTRFPASWTVTGY